MPPRRHLLHIGLVLALLAVLTGPVVLLTGASGEYHAGALEANLASFLRARHGLDVQPRDIVIPAAPDQRSGLRPVEVYFLGRRQGEKQRDLFFSHFILSSKAIPVHASPLFALTETKMADEQELRLDPARRFLAYASALDGKTSVVTILELAGLSDRDLRGFPARERLQQRLTSWQETGLWRGIGRVKVQLTVPQRVRLQWQDRLLEITNPRHTWRAAVDPQRAKVLRGPARAGRVRIPRRAFIAWAVDTVRNFSFVGADRIAWLEDLVFGMVDSARRMSGAKVSLAEIKDEMDLPVIRRRTTRIAGWPPSPLRPILGERMKGEGQWVEVEGPFLRTEPGMPSFLAATFVRPDRERLFSRLYFIAWDPRRIDLRMVAGLRNPTSATGLRGPGVIARRPALLKRLVAAFNGGFQSTHGDFGMMVNRKVYAPARPWGATVARLRDGSCGFGTWDGKLPFGLNPEWIDSFRQNLTALVEDGKFNPWQRGSWGGGTGFFSGKGAKAHTWRSGLCLHKSGYVMYALGNPIDGPTLGQAMTRVGCIYGMELDINVTHVGMEYVHALGPDEKDPPGADRFRTEKYFSHTGKWVGVDGFRYFMRVAIRGTGNMPFPRWTGRADEREFFYLVKRELLPGSDLSPLGRQPSEGRWTFATLPAAAHDFPPAMTRTFVHPDREDPQRRVHLVQLDLRWLDTSLCVPGPGSDCLPTAPKNRPVAVLPLGAFATGRKLFADGKSMGEGSGSAGEPYLDIRPLRDGGAALPAAATSPATDAGSISIQSAPAGTPPARSAVPITGALCAFKDDSVLLYASGLGLDREHLATALKHAGCKQVIHLGAAAPLVIVREAGGLPRSAGRAHEKDNANKDPLVTVFGKLVPPVADSPSLVFRRSNVSWGHRIFGHVEPQPRRVWTMVQPEWTRNSVRRHAGNIAKALGLPPIKSVNDLCRPPYSDHVELRKLRWRDPITGVMCGQGFAPRIEIDDTFKKVLKRRRTKRDRIDPATPGRVKNALEKTPKKRRPKKKRRQRRHR